MLALLLLRPWRLLMGACSAFLAAVRERPCGGGVAVDSCMRAVMSGGLQQGRVLPAEHKPSWGQPRPPGIRRLHSTRASVRATERSQTG